MKMKTRKRIAEVEKHQTVREVSELEAQGEARGAQAYVARKRGHDPSLVSGWMRDKRYNPAGHSDRPTKPPPAKNDLYDRFLRLEKLVAILWDERKAGM